MRHVPITLVALLLFATVASAQNVTPSHPPGSLDIVVARLMSFDRDNNGLVAKDELPDRMWTLVTGDLDSDGSLDRNEIAALVAVPKPVAIGGGVPRPGGYTFGDQFELSSRSHVLDTLDDLRLPDVSRAHALAVVRPFLDSVEAQATATLLKDLEFLLNENQLSRLRAAVDRSLATQSATVFRADGTSVQISRPSPDPAAAINQLPLPSWQRALALDAVRRFKERVRFGDADRVALLEHLKGIISDEEREDFGAALARRPLVKAGGFVTTVAFAERVVVTPNQAVVVAQPSR